MVIQSRRVSDAVVQVGQSLSVQNRTGHTSPCANVPVAVEQDVSTQTEGASEMLGHLPVYLTLFLLGSCAMGVVYTRVACELSVDRPHNCIAWEAWR